MMEILEMRSEEIDRLLSDIGYGHLACSRDEQPYVIPIFYVYDGREIFIYTTAGLKSDIIRRNPKVCLQVEEIREDGSWQSVVVIGEAWQITDREERERVVALVRNANPNLLPALAIKWANDWMRTNVEVVYRIIIKSMSGKFSSEVKIVAAGVKPS